MPKSSCPYCRTDEHSETNATNYAAVHYCSHCGQPFSPSAWPCPTCEAKDAVSWNPHDDPWEHYCFRCDVAFNRLGPSFDEYEVVQGTTRDSSPAAVGQAPLDIERMPTQTTGRFAFEIELRNAGSDALYVQGHSPIAVQYRVREETWWTIFGNPVGYSPDTLLELDPNQQLSWELTVLPGGLAGSDFFVKHRPLPSGEYRFVYWGFPEIDVAITQPFPIEFEYYW